MNKILIIKLSRLGDIIHTYPVIEYLHRKFPEAEIDWVVETRHIEAIIHHPYINKVIVCSPKNWKHHPFSVVTWNDIWHFRNALRENKYDIVIDLHGNTRSGIILSLINCSEKIGYSLASTVECLNVFFTKYRFDTVQRNARENSLSIVTSYFSEQSYESNAPIVLKILNNKLIELNRELPPILTKSKLTILISIGASKKNKQLSIETWITFLQLLSDFIDCTFLFIWGTETEQSMVNDIIMQVNNAHVLNKMDLSKLQHLMSRCNLVISTDSMALHLAATTSTPTFGIFGPTPANKLAPVGENHCAFQGTPPKLNVLKRLVARIIKAKDQPITYINSKELFDYFNNWWNSR